MRAGRPSISWILPALASLSDIPRVSAASWMSRVARAESLSCEKHHSKG